MGKQLVAVDFNSQILSETFFQEVNGGSEKSGVSF